MARTVVPAQALVARTVAADPALVPTTIAHDVEWFYDNDATRIPLNGVARPQQWGVKTLVGDMLMKGSDKGKCSLV
jgi:hypothetical protein